MAASYIEALIPPEETDQRWNYAQPIGTGGINLNFSFMTARPTYSTGAEGTNFHVLSADQKDAARSILDLYENFVNVHFTEVADANDTSTQIRFGLHNSTGGEAGYAYTPGQIFGTASLVTGDVWIVNGINNEVDPGEPGYATIMHEIGHALGLKHPFQDEGNHSHLPASTDNGRYSIMSYTPYPNGLFRDVTGTTAGDIHFVFVEPAQPMLYDIAALQYLYGANTSFHTGNDTYTFAKDVPIAECIWDAGGIDTISVANFTRGCEIDLTPGRFSSISIVSDPLPPGFVGGTQPTYTGEDNVGIAFGARIENAIGGKGADTLTGNGFANTLTGNAGNDKLDGGGGIDTLKGLGGNDILTWGAGDKPDGGTGNDTLMIKSGSLKLTTLANSVILNIETINMTGGGNNTLTLNANDVLAISSTTDTLKIMGNVGDKVDIVGTAFAGGTVAGFKTYTVGAGTLLIDTDITVV